VREILERIAGRRFFVIGDLYLDHYVFGSPQRVSREAPVMVLEEDRHEHRLGGGAAPALALAALACEVGIGGVVGDDAEGRRIVELLRAADIDAAHVLVDSSRPTTLKTRVVAEGFFLFPQQLVRIDRQERSPITPDVERLLSRSIRSADGEAVLVSDYRSGVVTEVVVDAVRDFQQVRGALTAVDSQGELRKFAGFDLVKCNQGEAEAVLNASISDDGQRPARLRELCDELGCRCLVVTRGGAGASVVTPENYQEVPAENRSEIYDVTGAGDTVVAVMAAALLAGAPAVDAARLAQLAAGIVVRKWGNAQASRAELAAALGTALTPQVPLP
jgi:rfaE bifunctional protein kinase chain/domain